jgi:ferredoxin-nitrite reductase
VTCSSQGAVGFPVLEAMAHRLHRHFTANPRFERLPKKFKIGIEADVSGRRHLIQDVGLVLADSNGGGSAYDVYVAGGLGREPQAGFLFESSVSENQIIPLIESIARVYAAHTPAGKRLKHLIREIGEQEFRRLVSLEPSFREELPPALGLGDGLMTAAGNRRVEVRFFGGVMTAGQLEELAEIAAERSDGVLMASADQDIAFNIAGAFDPEDVADTLQAAGFELEGTTFRICPGSHLCRVGLSPTRDVARAISDSMGPSARALAWALSGCPNSCTQPQLADVGVVSSSLARDDDGGRTPRFDLYRLNGEGLGTSTECALTLDELCAKVRNLG